MLLLFPQGNDKHPDDLLAMQFVMLLNHLDFACGYYYQQQQAALQLGDVQKVLQREDMIRHSLIEKKNMN